MISKFTSNQKLSLLAAALLVASSQSTFAIDRPAVFESTPNLIEQNPITGKVTSDNGPLAGATISVKGTSMSTSTERR